MSRPPSPSSRSSPFGAGYFSVPFERFARDEASDWAGAFTLLGMQAPLHMTCCCIQRAWTTDTMETYFDSHIDLLQRNLQKHSDRLKLNAEKAFKIRSPSGDVLSKEALSENFDREVKNFKLKVSNAMTIKMLLALITYRIRCQRV
jgi:hypothetical protein